MICLQAFQTDQQTHTNTNILTDKESFGSNFEVLASLFKPNSPKQAHSDL